MKLKEKIVLFGTVTLSLLVVSVCWWWVGYGGYAGGLRGE
jgi:hypothetical protein